MTAGRAPDGDKVSTDVLIVGAGPAGSAAAIALRRLGVPRVLLLNKPSKIPLAIGESVAPNIGLLLSRLGLNHRLEDMGHLPYHGNISLWGGPELVFDDFLKRGMGHGYHLDRAAFDTWLREQACEAGALLYSPVELEEAVRVERAFYVRFQQHGRKMEARAAVIVDASGRKAVLARRMGADVHKLDRLVALAAHARPISPAFGAAPSLSGQSLVEPVAEGWWYAAGLPSGRLIVTLMTDDDIAKAGRLRDPEMYRAAFERTARLSQMACLQEGESSEITVVSAATQYLNRALGLGWIAAGDALIGFDPLTSSGITGALDDALAAADTVVAWFSAKDGMAAAEAARVYVRRAEATLQRYLSEHQRWYARETRFADRPFWQRRIGGLAKPNSPS